jgi:hypothetical protein
MVLWMGLHLEVAQGNQPFQLQMCSQEHGIPDEGCRYVRRLLQTMVRGHTSIAGYSGPAMPGLQLQVILCLLYPIRIRHVSKTTWIDQCIFTLILFLRFTSDGYKIYNIVFAHKPDFFPTAGWNGRRMSISN